MNTGWIKMHRQLLDKSWYSNSKYVHLWITLLMLATHREREAEFKGCTIKLSPGQFVTGRDFLSKLTGISSSTVERILTRFEKIEHQIEQQKTNKNRLIIIKNWHLYQNSEHQNGQQADNKRTTNGQQTDTYNNDNNIKNDKNENIEPQVSDIERAKEFIIETFSISFFNSLGVHWKTRLKKHIDSHGLQNFLDSISRFKTYHSQGFKKGFAKRFNKLEENAAFFDEIEFQELLEKHRRFNGQSTSPIEIVEGGFIPQDRSKALDKMIKDDGSAGGKHE